MSHQDSGEKSATATQQALPVRLGVTDLTFHHATAAVVAHVLRKMGLTVELSYAMHEANFAQLRSGQIDMIASAWIPFSHGVYKAQVEEVMATRELGLHYQPYALWGVPDYVPEAAVASIEDLLLAPVRANMTPLIQGIGPGAGITRFSLQIMQDYGLEAAGYVFKTGSQQDCIDAFERAVAERRWVVVPLWQPQFLHANYAIRELKDSRGLLGGVDRAVLLARQDRLARWSTAQIAVLDRIRLGNAVVSGLDYDINRRGLTADQAAQAWLHSHSDIVSQWLGA